MKPTPKKKRRSKAPAPKPTKVRGGRSRSEHTKVSKAAAEAKRLHKNEQARARRAAIKQAKRAQSLAHMRPGKRTAFLAREQRNEQSDRAAWKKAGKPYAFERWQSYRDGARTRKTLSLKVELSHKRAQIFGYEDAKGNDTGKVPERHMLEGSNPDHRTLLIEMMRSGDQRWLDYLDEAYDLGLDYDEAADTWFSPEV